MKNFIILLCCFATTVLFAQEKETNPIDWDKMLQKVDQSKIQSGILMDKLLFNNKLLAFNSEKYNMADNEYFKKSLTDLYQLSDKKRFISPDSLASYTIYTQHTNQVAVAVLNTTYEKLNYNLKETENSGLKMVDNVLVPIEGKPSFVTQKLFMAAPLAEYFVGKTVDFVFDQNLIFNNGENTIKSLIVAFGEKTQENEVTIIKDGKLIQSNLKIDYTENGFKSLRFTVTLNNETQITSYSRMYVQTAAAALCDNIVRERGIFTSTIPFQGYNAGDVPLFGKTDYTIFYHTNNGNTQKRLLKPIILVDGFDPGDKRKSQDCDCENDPACYLANSTTTAHTTVYANGMGISHTTYTTSFNAINHKSIEDNMDYIGLLPDGTTGPINFLDILRDAGYDVIVINNINYQVLDTANPVVTYTYWVPAVINPGGIGYINIPGHWVSITSPNIYHIDGGADYIERNAMTLVSFIQNYVRPQQSLAGGTDDLVMVGPSMGGQITRYALAYMEKKFAETSNPIWKHHTKLWVSLDSPHLGANIPIALQSCVWFMGDGNYAGSGSANETYSNVLNSTAAKQMNINNYEYSRTSGNPQNSPFFTHYYNNLNNNGVSGSNGFPVSNSSFRKIAIANGSLTGQKQGNDGEIFFHGKLIVPITDEVAGFLGSNIFTGPLAIATAVFGNFSLIGLEVKNRFEPSTYQSNTIFEGTFYKKSDYTFMNYRLNFQNNDNRGSLSVAPGGWTDFTTDLKKGIQKGASDAGGYAYFPVEITNSGFIPTFSSLAHLQPNQNWSNPLNTNLTCPSNKLTPFDSYFGEATNTEHTSFNKDSAAWLLQELAGNPQAPHFPIQAGLLTGPDLMCNSNTMYSFLDDCKLPSTVTWSVTNLNIVSSTPYSIIVSKINDGQGTITATFQNGQTVIKNIWVGKPSFNLVYNYFEPQPIKSTIDMVSDQPDLTIEQQGITSTTFLGTRNNSSYFNMLKTSLYSARANTSSVNQVIATATNSCGTTTLTVNFIDILKQSGNTIPPKVDSKIYSVFPNPASSIVSIELNDIYNQPDSSSIISGELFDMMGLSKSKVEITDNKAVFSVVGLLKGIYVLKIYINDQVESHQIGVE